MQVIDYLCKYLHNEAYRRHVSASKCAVAIANVMESKSCSSNCGIMESCATVLRNLSCIENEGDDPVIACTYLQCYELYVYVTGVILPLTPSVFLRLLTSVCLLSKPCLAVRMLPPVSSHASLCLGQALKSPMRLRQSFFRTHSVFSYGVT